MKPINVTPNDPDLKYMYITDHVRYAYRHLRWIVIVRIAEQLNIQSHELTTRFEDGKEFVFIRWGEILGELKPEIIATISGYDLSYNFIPNEIL